MNRHPLRNAVLFAALAAGCFDPLYEEPIDHVICCNDGYVDTCPCAAGFSCRQPLTPCALGRCSASLICPGAGGGAGSDAGAAGGGAGTGGGAGGGAAGGGAGGGTTGGGGGGASDGGLPADAGVQDAGVMIDAGTGGGAGGGAGGGSGGGAGGGGSLGAYEFCCVNARVSTCACPFGNCPGAPFTPCPGGSCVAGTATGACR